MLRQNPSVRLYRSCIKKVWVCSTDRELSYPNPPMQCPLCGHPKSHKHGKTSKGSHRYRCPHCHQTFSETFDTLYYRRQISLQTLQKILQSHAEGSGLRGLARITGWHMTPV